jgi:hypothetical protein
MSNVKYISIRFYFRFFESVYYILLLTIYVYLGRKGRKYRKVFFIRKKNLKKFSVVEKSFLKLRPFRPKIIIILL